MKRILSILAGLLVFCEAILCQKPSVAVYVVGNQSRSTMNTLEGSIINELSLSGKFRIADRSDVIENAIAKEYSKQSSGSVNFDQVMKLGSQIGAEYLLVADLNYSSYNSITNIITKLINVEENTVLAGENWSGILLDKIAPQLGKIITKEILKTLSKSSNSRKPKIVGPFTFQQAIDYEIPKGYSSFDFTVRDGINTLYDNDLFVNGGGRFVLSRTKRKSNNRIYEMLYFIRNFTESPEKYKNRDSSDWEKDYYSYCYGKYPGSCEDRETYTLEVDKNGNVRYIDSKGKKQDKNFEPGGYFYIILIPYD